MCTIKSICFHPLTYPEPHDHQNGYLDVRDAPGLGITIREDIVEKYALEKV